MGITPSTSNLSSPVDTILPVIEELLKSRSDDEVDDPFQRPFSTLVNFTQTHIQHHVLACIVIIDRKRKCIEFEAQAPGLLEAKSYSYGKGWAISSIPLFSLEDKNNWFVAKDGLKKDGQNVIAPAFAKEIGIDTLLSY